MKASRFWFILLLILACVIGHLSFFKYFQPELYRFELVITVAIILIALRIIITTRDSVIYYWVACLFFALNIFNFMLIRLFVYKPLLVILMLIISLVGFVYTFNKLEDKKEEDYEHHLRKKYRKISEDLRYISVGEPKIIVEKVEPEKKSQSRTAKYVASKLGEKVYKKNHHLAKQIKRSNKVFFTSIEEAKRKGYKPHESVK